MLGYALHPIQSLNRVTTVAATLILFLVLSLVFLAQRSSGQQLDDSALNESNRAANMISDLSDSSKDRPSIDELQQSELNEEERLKALDKRMRDLIAIQIRRQLNSTPADEKNNEQTSMKSADALMESKTPNELELVPPLSNHSDQTGNPPLQQPASESENPLADSKRITAYPVDQLALADSLYQGSELEMALEIYTKLESTDPNQQNVIWIQLQIASCHRLMGKPDEATKYYRIVANSDDVGFVTSVAKWWLDTMEKRRILEDQADRISQFNQSIKAETSDEASIGN